MFISKKEYEERKSMLIEYYKTNIHGVITLGLIACIITFKTGGKDYFKSLLTMVIGTWVTWVGHYLLHNYNKYNPIAKIHKITHHSKFAHTFMGKLIEYLIIEFFFFGGGILLILIILYYRSNKNWLLDPYVLLYWSIAVPFIHEFYYHMLTFSQYHKLHHKNNEKVYSPEIWDIVYGTKYENVPVYDEGQLIPSMILLLVIYLPFINTKYDIIKYLIKCCKR